MEKRRLMILINAYKWTYNKDMCILNLPEMREQVMCFSFWKVVGSFIFYLCLSPVFWCFWRETAGNSHLPCLLGHLSGNPDLFRAFSTFSLQLLCWYYRCVGVPACAVFLGVRLNRAICWGQGKAFPFHWCDKSDSILLPGPSFIRQRGAHLNQ